MEIIKLPKHFKGKGEVKNFDFEQVKSGVNAYLYQVSKGQSKWYEVFKKTYAPICIDFDKRIYSENQKKEVYPKAKLFGVIAWCLDSKKSAIELFNKIEKKQNERI